MNAGPIKSSAVLVGSDRPLAEPKLSPDGLTVTFSTATANGTALVGIALPEGAELDGFGPETVLTVDPPIAGAHPSGGGSYDWLPDSSGLIYVAKAGGLYEIDRLGSLGKLVVAAPSTSPSSSSTAQPAARLWSPTVSPDGQFVAFVIDDEATQSIGIALRNQRVASKIIIVAGASMDPSAGVVNRDFKAASEGSKTQAHNASHTEHPPTNTDNTANFRCDPAWGPNGLLSWHEWQDPHMPWDESRIVCTRITVDPNDVSKVTVGPIELTIGATQLSTSQPRFSSAGVLGWLDDRSGYRNVRIQSELTQNPAVHTPAEEEFEHAGPTWGPGNRSWCWSPSGDEVAFVRNEGGFARLCITNASSSSPSTANAASAIDDIQATQVQATQVPQAKPATEATQATPATPTADQESTPAKTAAERPAIPTAGLEATATVPAIGTSTVAAAPARVQPGVRDLARAVHIGVSWATTLEGVSRIAAVRTGGKTPTQLVVYDVASGDRTTVARGHVGAYDGFTIPEPEAVSWIATDGATVHGRIYRPENPSGPNGVTGPTPMIVSVHGGPTDQNMVAFNSRFVHWLGQGWSILVPDYRGSTGWGRKYTDAMRGRWGDLDVSDCADGTNHAITQGWADPARVVIMGGSAGGLTALHLLARFGELFAGGIVLYPVTDLDALDATTHRYEKHYNASLVGARTDLLYAERSPVSHVSLITKPLLILHGDADPVVGVDQSRAIAEQLTALGREVELVVYEGEGHGWRKPETRIDEINRIDSFLARFN